jgi:hypothetical protein
VWVASRHLSCSFGHLAIMPGVGLSSMYHPGFVGAMTDW